MNKTQNTIKAALINIEEVPIWDSWHTHRSEGAVILDTSMKHATSGLIVLPCPFKVSQCHKATMTKF